MSANEKMVMMPRDTVENAAELLQEYNKCGIARDLRAILAKPAQQGQGEPVAHLCKSEGAKWLQYGSKVGDPWEPGEVEVTPLYTHADPAEASKWRNEAHRFNLEVERLRESERKNVAAADKWHGRFVEAARKLAEAQALLGRASKDLEHIQKECAGDVTPGYIGCLVDDVVDLLSATAEPSAPLPPVDGDLLPPINSKVLIHLGREDKWVEHTVVGYYAWGNHGLDQNVHRVFVRVRDAEGCLNARLLNDIRPVTLERKP